MEPIEKGAFIAVIIRLVVSNKFNKEI